MFVVGCSKVDMRCGMGDVKDRLRIGDFGREVGLFLPKSPEEDKDQHRVAESLRFSLRLP
jgi:hypothetical protein